MITVEAIYENGVLKPKQALALAEGTSVRLSITTLQEEDDPLDAVIGICTEGPDISLAERHDEFLYGIKPREEKQP
jgi:predicted DNA-binding antitoxin AbrB/MazE fold protein